jgi:DNA-binding MarR family transcriptional regulator
MNQKHIGILLIVAGLILSGIVFSIKNTEDTYTNLLIKERGGSCFLADGTCLHDINTVPYIAGWVFSATMVLIGIYLLLFDSTQQKLTEQNMMISDALLESKKLEKGKSEFGAFLAGFSEAEQTVLKAIKEQDGIQQSTLRYRTGMSKTALSLMLGSLEGKGIITRKVSGKTNQVFLRKKF